MDKSRELLIIDIYKIERKGEKNSTRSTKNEILLLRGEIRATLLNTQFNFHGVHFNLFLKR